MIHLSRLIVGIRHRRVFRMKNLSGEIVDRLVKIFPDQFTRVSETQPNDESILSNSNNTQFIRFNRDDVFFEHIKVFNWEAKNYIEINKKKLVDTAKMALPVFLECLKLNDDFMRIGIIFEFRIPKWESLTDEKLSVFVAEKFINFPTKGEIGGGFVRLAYKLRAPGVGAIKKLEDFRNVIITIDESTGINEAGKEEKCLLVSADMQHIFKPFQKTIYIDDHYVFATEHLKSTILPIFKEKGIDINYEQE